MNYFGFFSLFLFFLSAFFSFSFLFFFFFEDFHVKYFRVTGGTHPHCTHFEFSIYKMNSLVTNDLIIMMMMMMMMIRSLGTNEFIL